MGLSRQGSYGGSYIPGIPGGGGLVGSGFTVALVGSGSLCVTIKFGWVRGIWSTVLYFGSCWEKNVCPFAFLGLSRGVSFSLFLFDNMEGDLDEIMEEISLKCS